MKMKKEENFFFLTYLPNKMFHSTFRYTAGTVKLRQNCLSFGRLSGFSLSKISNDFRSSTLRQPTFS